MNSRVSYKPRGGVLSFVVCLALLLGACVFAWLVFGGSIDKLFTALGNAISRAGS